MLEDVHTHGHQGELASHIGNGGPLPQGVDGGALAQRSGVGQKFPTKQLWRRRTSTTPDGGRTPLRAAGRFNRADYFSVTVLDADPPRLLFTVMFPGFVATLLNVPR